MKKIILILTITSLGSQLNAIQSATQRKKIVAQETARTQAQRQEILAVKKQLINNAKMLIGKAQLLKKRTLFAKNLLNKLSNYQERVRNSFSPNLDYSFGLNLDHLKEELQEFSTRYQHLQYVEQLEDKITVYTEESEMAKEDIISFKRNIISQGELIEILYPGDTHMKKQWMKYKEIQKFSNQIDQELKQQYQELLDKLIDEEGITKEQLELPQYTFTKKMLNLRAKMRIARRKNKRLEQQRGYFSTLEKEFIEYKDSLKKRKATETVGTTKKRSRK